MRRAKRNALLAGALAAAMGAGLHLNTYELHLARVIDADTLEGGIQIWPGQYIGVKVRVNGIDTPEKRRPNKLCAEKERQKALEATQFVKDLIEAHEHLTISRPFPGKYGGRIIADVYLISSKDPNAPKVSLGQTLIDNGFAYAYDGGRKKSWCKLLQD